MSMSRAPGERGVGGGLAHVVENMLRVSSLHVWKANLQGALSKSVTLQSIGKVRSRDLLQCKRYASISVLGKWILVQWPS